MEYKGIFGMLELPTTAQGEKKNEANEWASSSC
jgi:hypothetical protein